MACRECVQWWMGVVLTIWQWARYMSLGTLWQCTRLRTTLWVCRELVRVCGGSTEWDRQHHKIQERDPTTVFEETMCGKVSDWGRNVMYVNGCKIRMTGSSMPHLTYLKVEDRVHLGPFKKEVFMLKCVIPRQMTTYRLTEWNGMPVEGQFYKEDVQCITMPNEALFRVEKIVQRHGTQVKVQRMGWPSKYDSWIPKSALTSSASGR